MILLIAFVLILICFTILQSLLNASLSEIVVHLYANVYSFLNPEKRADPNPRKERNTGSARWILSTIQAYLSCIYIFLGQHGRVFIPKP